MDFRTLAELPLGEMQIKHADRILVLGSCFAEQIGRRLADHKFRCDVNPYGVLYNPLSVLEALKEIRSRKVYTSGELFCHQGIWHSPMHHGSFSDASPNVCLDRINDRLSRASGSFSQTDYLILTLGSAYIYTSDKSGKIVGNCHKLSEKQFERRLLAVEEIVGEYSRFIRDVEKENPAMKWLFTVSPVRHLRDGLHGNQVSKAVLLLAVERLKALFPTRVFYFPAYELLTDDLRDYRFYAADMLHPSEVAVTYIWECFVKSYFPEETRRFMQEWEEIIKALNHKPFDPGSENYKSFLMQNVLKIKRVKEKYPYLDVENELEICHIRLKR